jgi:uncharacterized protein YegP (UPF0339 family)
MANWKDRMAEAKDRVTEAAEKAGVRVNEAAEKVGQEVNKASEALKQEPTGEFEVYQDAKGEFRWRLQDTNNRIIADSGEGYTTKANCLAGIEDVRTAARSATINDKTFN